MGRNTSVSLGDYLKTLQTAAFRKVGSKMLAKLFEPD